MQSAAIRRASDMRVLYWCACWARCWRSRPLQRAAHRGPLDTINNLSDLVFQCVRAVGVIVAGYGIVQIGLAVQSHDSSQRANGFLAFFGGLLIMFAKEILDFITV